MNDYEDLGPVERWVRRLLVSLFIVLFLAQLVAYFLIK